MTDNAPWWATGGTIYAFDKDWEAKYLGRRRHNDMPHGCFNEMGGYWIWEGDDGAYWCKQMPHGKWKARYQLKPDERVTQ